MSLVDYWWMQGIARTYASWTDNAVIPRAERDHARERVTSIRAQLGRLDTQDMPTIH